MIKEQDGAVYLPWKVSLARFLIASLLALSIAVCQLGLSPHPVAAASCATSGPSSGLYLVTVCLTQPR